MKPALNRLYISLLITTVLLLGATVTGHCQTDENIAHINIKMSDVHITWAIENLAHLANLNYMIDPELFKPSGGSNSNGIPETSLSIDWTNLTVKAALAGVLKAFGLVMVQDQFTTVTLITGTNHVAKVVDASLLVGTNAAALVTNGTIPVVRFEMVPLDQALKSLIEQEHLNVELDPKVSDYVDSTNPMAVKFHNAPLVSLRWEKLTARQAIAALCENYNLAIIKDAATGVVLIKPKA